MRVKSILLIILLLIFFNCKKQEEEETKTLIRVTIDIDNKNELNWQKDKFITKCNDLIKKINQEIIINILDSTDDFEILKNNSFDYSKLSTQKETKKNAKKQKYQDYIICVRPQLDYKDTLQYSVIFASTDYKKKDFDIINKSFDNIDAIITTLQKNIPTTEKTKPFFFVWEEEIQYASLTLVTDESSDVDWDKEAYEESIKELFTNNLQRKILFYKKNLSFDIDAIKNDPQQIFTELNIETVNNENNYLIYINPYMDQETSSARFEMAFFTTDADIQNIETIKSTLSVPQDLVDKISPLFNNSQFTEKTKIYIWTAPAQVPKTIYLYKSFADIETLSGIYLLIESIPDIVSNRKIDMNDILYNGEFLPQENKKCKEITEYLTNNDCASLFYNKDKTLKATKIVFVEYITTGDRYIISLLGPIKDEDFSDTRAFLKQRKIKTYSNPVYPYDLK